jgi:hypothetical protein
MLDGRLNPPYWSTSEAIPVSTGLTLYMETHVQMSTVFQYNQGNLSDAIG